MTELGRDYARRSGNPNWGMIRASLPMLIARSTNRNLKKNLKVYLLKWMERHFARSYWQPDFLLGPLETQRM